MPICPKYTWQETDTQLEVNVDITGVTDVKRPSVFATRALLKVVAHPYLLLLDLAQDVDFQRSTAVLRGGHVVFTLRKLEAVVWGKLTYAGDKAEALKRRNDSIDEAHAQLEEQRQQRITRVKAQKKAATDRQIEIDRKKRREIERAKAAELDAERSKLNQWHTEIEAQNVDESDEEEEPQDATAAAQASDEAGMSDHPDYYGRGYVRPPADPSPIQAASAGEASAQPGAHDSAAARGATAAASEREGAVWRPEEVESGTGSTATSDSNNSEHQGEAAAAVVPLLPPPRMPMEAVKVNFTKLEFPHLPARAQREEEIRVYKKKQQDAAAMVDSVDIGDRQPVFLKDKGDGLFRQHNYLAACNAYSRAIDGEAEDTMLSLTCRLNRAACQLKLEAFSSCISDCDRVVLALEAAEAAVRDGRHADPEGWRKLYVKALVRRSTAQAKTDEVEQAIAGLTEAQRYDRENAQIDAILTELKAGATPADADSIKLRAAARFKAGNFGAAAEAYATLATWPGSSAYDTAAALSNRAACLMHAGAYEASMREGGKALRTLLGEAYATCSPSLAPWIQSGEAAACPRQEALLVMKVVARCASCQAHLRRFGAAAATYLEAAEIAVALGGEAHAAAFRADAEGMSEKQSTESALANTHKIVDTVSAPDANVADGALTDSRPAAMTLAAPG